jgi:hypothetical protein
MEIRYLVSYYYFVVKNGQAEALCIPSLHFFVEESVINGAHLIHRNSPVVGTIVANSVESWLFQTF